MIDKLDDIIYFNNLHIKYHKDPKERLDMQLGNLEWKKKYHPRRVAEQEILIGITKKEIETGTKLEDVEIAKYITNMEIL